MFRKYERLVTEVQAVQFTEQNKACVFNSLTGQYAAGEEDGKPILKITTIHGDIAIVRIGDWIVKEATLGFYYPVKDDVFRNCYA